MFFLIFLFVFHETTTTTTIAKSSLSEPGGSCIARDALAQRASFFIVPLAYCVSFLSSTRTHTPPPVNLLTHSQHSARPCVRVLRHFQNTNKKKSKQLKASSWQQQQRVGELCDWIYVRIPKHLGVAKLLEAAEYLLSKNQHELARRKCFIPVSEAGLLEDGFPKGDLTMTDRRRMHVVALFGIARCDAALLSAGDDALRHPQTLARRLDVLSKFREATQIALLEETLYWLVHNGTVHIHEVCSPMITAGFSGEVVEYLIFAVLCFEAHVLLAAPKWLKWRVALITEVCHCYDDVKKPEQATSFIQRSLAEIKDLQALEALDPVPQKPEVAALYADAEKTMRILSARHDESLTDPAALTAKLEEEGAFPKPGDKARCLLEILHDPARRVVRHAPPTEGSHAAAAMTAAAGWVAPHCAALTVGLNHAAATRAALEALHEKEAEEARAAEEAQQLTGGDAVAAREAEGEGPGDGADAGEEGEPAEPAEPTKDDSAEPTNEAGGEDAEAAAAPEEPADPTKPPPDLEPDAIAAFDAAVLELPLNLHAALLKQAFNYEYWDTFHSLHALAKLRLSDIASTASDHQHEMGTVFDDHAIALGVASDVLSAVRAVQSEGDGGGGGGKDDPASGGGEGAEGEAGAEGEEEGPDALHALGETLGSLPPQSSRSCADVITDAALLLWSLVKGVFTDATRDGAPPEEESLVVDLLSGIHAAFQLVDLEDGALRATLALRLSLMLERRGDARSAAVVASHAVAAAEKFRDAAVDRSRGADDEPTRYITAESVWGASSGGGTAGEDGTGPGPVDGTTVSPFSFTPTSLSESDQAYACLHADVLAVHFRLQLAVGLLDQREEADRRLARVVNKVNKREMQSDIYGVKSAWDLKREAAQLERADTVPPNPVAAEQRLLEEVNANPWQKAVLLVQMAALRPKQDQRAAILEEAAGCLLSAERGERELLAAAPPPLPFTIGSSQGGGGPSKAPSAEASSMSLTSTVRGGGGRRTLTPAAPSVLCRTSTSVTIVPPAFCLKSSVPDKPPPIAATYMVLAKPYGTGLAPGMHNTELPNTGVKFPVGGVPSVTITGLSPNENYCFAVVAFDADGEVINGQGAATGAIATVNPLPSTPLWSLLAIAASRLGCVAVARRAAGTVHKRFVVTTRDRET